jgi:cytochrome c-type biogenesis protein CcmH
MIWLIFAVLTAGVILLITRSLRRAPSTQDAPLSEIEVYKNQLAELSRDEERGALGKEEAEQTRAEISRRLLRASRQSVANAPEAAKMPGAIVSTVAVAAVVAIGAGGVYSHYGKPAAQDQPLEARLSAPLVEQSLDVQVANMERRLRENPADVAGWTAIASVYFKSGIFDKAADSFQKAIDAGGETEDRLLGLAESLTFANDGVITDEGARALRAALKHNPQSLRGRFWSGLLAEQDGKKEDAEKIYRGMLAGEIHPALRNIVTERLQGLTAAASNSAEPDQAAPKEAQASADALEGGQGKIIRGMVERLAERLKENKSDLEGWLRLIRSYAVLKETDKAQDAVATARQQFAADAKALEQIDTLAQGLGLAGMTAAASSSPEPGQATAPKEAQAPADALEGEQGKMIRGMVNRLAERLKEDKSDLDGWLRLIRSYAVLKETDKAQDAAATARQQFASDAKALEQIDTLAQGLGLASPGAGGGQPKS